MVRNISEMSEKEVMNLVNTNVGTVARIVGGIAINIKTGDHLFSVEDNEFQFEELDGLGNIEFVVKRGEYCPISETLYGIMDNKSNSYALTMSFTDDRIRGGL